jgi:cyclopropane fatty-acyl-phospholipid synthase-like methyltransferase
MPKKFTAPLNKAEDLFALAQGFMGSRLFITAMDLEVFQIIGNKKLTVAQIAELTSTDEKALEILLNALVSIGLLVKSEGLFSNVEEVAQFVLPENPNYKGDILSHIGNSWDSWSRLTEIIRNPRSYSRQWTNQTRTDLALTMKQQSEGKAAHLARLIDGHGKKHLIDLGSGPGSYSIALANNYPGLNITLFDSDELALNMAEQEIVRQKLQGRISLQKGDFFKDDLGVGYDLVLLSSILCLLGEEKINFLLRKVKRALNNYGQVVVLEQKLEDSKTQPVASAMLSVNMLVSTPEGRCYTYSEIKNMLQTAGFQDIYYVPFGTYHVIFGKKD